MISSVVWSFADTLIDRVLFVGRNRVVFVGRSRVLFVGRHPISGNGGKEFRGLLGAQQMVAGVSLLRSLRIRPFCTSLKVQKNGKR